MLFTYAFFRLNQKFGVVFFYLRQHKKPNKCRCAQKLTTVKKWFLKNIGKSSKAFLDCDQWVVGGSPSSGRPEHEWRVHCPLSTSPRPPALQDPVAPTRLAHPRHDLLGHGSLKVWAYTLVYRIAYKNRSSLKEDGMLFCNFTYGEWVLFVTQKPPENFLLVVSFVTVSKS